MLKVIGKYLRLMRDHDFSYQYSDDPEFWAAENRKGCELKRLEQLLSTKDMETVAAAFSKCWKYREEIK